jgi:hypothetical protein
VRGVGQRKGERQNGSSSFSEEGEEDEPGMEWHYSPTASLPSLPRTTWAGLAAKPRRNFAASSLLLDARPSPALLRTWSSGLLLLTGRWAPFLKQPRHMRLRARDRRIRNGRPKPRVTGGRSVQSQPLRLRAWELGLTTSHHGDWGDSWA